MNLLRAVFFVLAVASGNVFAVATCSQTSMTCADATPCKTISGVQVCLSGVVLPPGAITNGQSCWAWNGSYTCVDPNATIDTCAAQKANPSCAVANTNCVNMVGGTCALTEDVYQCGPTIDPALCSNPTSACQDIASGTPSCITVGQYTVCQPAAVTKPVGSLLSAQNCWKDQITYSCIDPGVLVNTCATQTAANSGCAQTGVTCLKSVTVNGVAKCILNERTYGCGAYAQANCQLGTGPTCADATPSKIIGGGLYEIALTGTVPPAGAVLSPSSCWVQTSTFTCLNTSNPTNTCGTLQSDPNCMLQPGSTCLSKDAAGNCLTWQQTYVCTTQPAQNVQQQNCQATQFCAPSGQCFTVGGAQHHDMAQAASIVELLRQAGNYMDPATMRFFKGGDNTCENKLWGLGFGNCCEIKAGGQNNYQAMATSAVVNFASNYVYDMLGVSGTSSSFTGAALGSAYDFAKNYISNGSMTMSFSYMGFGVTTATTAAASSTTTTLGTIGLSNGTTLTFTFDPYSLAISLAIMYIQSQLACTDAERMLQMRRGQNLCVYVGNWCSNSFLGACLTVTEAYCCYNSKLARIINEQGLPQIGRNFGTAQAMDCKGFTVDELKKLDFSRIDMTEFIKDMTSRVNAPGGAVQKMQTKVQQMQQNNNPVNSSASMNTPGNYNGGWQPVSPP